MKMRIADLLVDCRIPGTPRQFLPFACRDEGEADLTLDCNPEEDPPEKGQKVDDFTNDAGHIVLYRRIPVGWVVELSIDGGPVHTLWSDRVFARSYARLEQSDPQLPAVICSLVRLCFSQRLISLDGMMIHASAVVLDDRCYLALGKSGTGKSTHTRLWMKAFPQAWLLNDDNPVIRLRNGVPVVYGTPWSGSTDCYKAKSAPLQGIVRLEQWPSNEWEDLHGVKAWTSIFPSCSLINRDELLYLYLIKTLNTVATTVKVGYLKCLPDEEAARMSRENLG